MKAQDMIVKSMKRAKEERGLRVTKPNRDFAILHAFFMHDIS